LILRRLRTTKVVLFQNLTPDEIPMRIGSAVRWLAALILTVCASLLAAQSFDLDRDREPVISLDGMWRFHPGDSPKVPKFNQMDRRQSSGRSQDSTTQLASVAQ